MTRPSAKLGSRASRRGSFQEAGPAAFLAALSVNAAIVLLLCAQGADRIEARGKEDVVYIDIEPVALPPSLQKTQQTPSSSQRASLREPSLAASSARAEAHYPAPRLGAGAVSRSALEGPTQTLQRPPLSADHEAVAGRSGDGAGDIQPRGRPGSEGARSRYGPPNCASPQHLSASERLRCDESRLARQPPQDRAFRSATEDDRTDSFAREAAAKERWRAYRRLEGDYPGLLSMMGKN